MNRRRGIRWGVAVLLAGLAIAGCAVVWIPDPAVSVAQWHSPEVVFRGESTSGQIALTIDDGPDPDSGNDLCGPGDDRFAADGGRRGDRASALGFESLQVAFRIEAHPTRQIDFHAHISPQSRGHDRCQSADIIV